MSWHETSGKRSDLEAVEAAPGKACGVRVGLVPQEPADLRLGCPGPFYVTEGKCLFSLNLGFSLVNWGKSYHY